MKEKDTEKQLKALEEAVRQEQETGGKTAKKHRESSSAAAKESHPLASFLIGLVLLGAGIFWVLNSFVVSFSWGSLWGGFGMNTSLATGLMLVPLLIGIGLLFFLDRKWIGWLAIIAPFLIMTFYSVLGGYCIYYMVINVVGMFSGMPDSSSFGALLTNPWASIGCMVLFMLICYLINRGGVGGGIEKFNTIGMPALFVMLVIVIIRAWTLPNADVGLKYMFVPGYALKAGFFDKAPGFMEVLATAGGQMFFSLSLAMGAMITYGSYLGKNENLPKNSVIIVISDTMVAIMAGLAVIPAAVANGIAKGMAVSEIKLGGPNLLFATLQDVFHDMGTIGGIFGLIFYALVLIAAISSAISLIEAVSVTFIDHASAKGHERDRNKVLAVVCLAITLLACLVAVDGLGSNGIAPKDLFHINSKADWCADWLDFMDMISEGIAMPLGAMLMSIMVGWEIKPKSLYGEIDSGYNGHIHGFYTFCIKYLCPVIMFFILLVQISTFFGLGWFN
jgi:NSS family neurotransmitter:Na+ symporter